MPPKPRTKNKKPRTKIKHAVILVNYRGWEDTIVCINSINKCKDAPHIIVVDNGSGGESVSKLIKAFPELDLIKTSENLGFSAGNNIGIKKALRMGAKVVHLLNNDTEVDPNLFSRAYRYTAGKNRITGAKIYYAKGHEFHKKQKGRGDVIWYAGGRMNWDMAISKHIGVDEIDCGQHDKIMDTEFVTGCYMAIPRKIFRKIGMLDESFFLYLEDSDYCLRAIHARVEVKYHPKLTLYHRNSSSTEVGSPLVDYYMTRNRFLIGKRYGTWQLRFALLREALFRNWYNPIRRMAFIDYLTGRMGNKNDQIQAVITKMGK